MNTKEAIVYVKTLKSLIVIDKAGLKVTLCEEFLDRIIDLLQRGKELEITQGELKEKLSQNPYPEEIFPSIPEEDFDKINDWLKKELGYPIDRLSGNLGRKIYKSIIEIIKGA